MWSFIALLGVTGAGLFLAFVVDLPRPGGPVVLPWFVMAVAFYLVEIKVVHLHFRRGAHSFSLSEIPVVIGLFFAAPSDVVVWHALAGGAALVVHRRLPPVKLAFNVATFVLGTATAVTVFHTLAPGGGFGPVQGAAAILATLATNVVGMLCVTTVISLSEGRPRTAKIRHVALMSTAVAVTNASVALMAVALALADVRALWLLAIPLVTLFIGYRSYLAEYQQHEVLELLYESSRIIQRSPELDSALVALLDHTRVMFRAERAEIRLYANETGTQVLVTAVGPRDGPLVMQQQDSPASAWVRSRLRADGKAFIIPAGDDGADAAPSDIAGAIIAPLRNDGRPVGFMMVAGRSGPLATFNDDDVQLFETVANHAATALENGQLERSLAQLSSLKEELRFQAYHDPLTGLANRALFIDEVATRFSPNAGGVLAVLFVDVDDFKLVNDSFGHGAGDALLVEIGQRLKGCVRANDVVARLGGDEFAILLVDDESLSRAQAIAERVIAALEAPFEVGSREVRAAASIGIAARTGAVEVPQELMRNADVAMYVAKSRGKGQAAVFEAGMHATMIERHELGSALHRAVGADEFVLSYQPIVDVRRGVTVGGEALIRWRHPTRGVIPPGDFIAVAEESDVIVPIGRWVLEEACLEARRWETPSAPAPWVSVNLSARHVHHPSFEADVVRALDVSGLEPGRLVLEVTETLLVQDLDGSAAKLAALKRMGVRIAIDDFGTGYSSLSYLRRFPVDMLKIAQEFVDVGDEDGWAFAHAIVSLAQRLGLQVVAEGVERASQAERLRLMSCDLAQGYHFAEPLDGEGMLRRVARETALDRSAPIAGRGATVAAVPAGA